MVVEVEGLRMRYGSRDVLDDVSFGVDRGRWWRCSDRTGPARPRRSRSSRASGGVRPAASRCWASTPRTGRAVACPRRRRPAVVARPRQVAGARAPRAPGVVLRAVLDAGPPRARGTSDELMAAVGLTDQADQEVRRLSGGQRRRLDVAVGAVGRPELLFLDEPTAGLRPARPGGSSTTWCAGSCASTGRRSCSPPTTSRRPRPGGPHPRAGRRPHRGRRHRGRPGAPLRGRRRGALDGGRRTVRAVDAALHRVRARALPRARRGRRRPGDPARVARGRLPARSCGGPSRDSGWRHEARARARASIELRQSVTGAGPRRPPALARRDAGRPRPAAAPGPRCRPEPWARSPCPASWGCSSPSACCWTSSTSAPTGRTARCSAPGPSPAGSPATSSASWSPSPGPSGCTSRSSWPGERC